MFENMAVEQGATAVRYPILEDVYETIRDAVKEAVAVSDMVSERVFLWMKSLLRIERQLNDKNK